MGEELGPNEDSCIVVQGTGHLVGDRLKLKGEATVTFDGVERHASVGLYLFQMTENPDGGMTVSTQYQFNWDNGDSFLSKDQASFEPDIEPDTWRFNVKLEIVAGFGLFEGKEGEPLGSASSNTTMIRFAEFGSGTEGTKCLSAGVTVRERGRSVAASLGRGGLTKLDRVL